MHRRDTPVGISRQGSQGGDAVQAETAGRQAPFHVVETIQVPKNIIRCGEGRIHHGRK
jgi:hypothetical protein